MIQRIRTGLVVIAITGVSFGTGNADSATSFDVQYLKELSDLPGDGISRHIDCSESRLAPKNERLTGKGPCLRATFPEDRGSQLIRDKRLFQFKGRYYAAALTLVKGSDRSNAKADARRDSTAVSTYFVRTFTDWGKTTKFSAGLTRRFSRADAIDENGLKCVTLSARRPGQTRLAIVTCGETLPAKDELKEVLKSFK